MLLAPISIIHDLPNWSNSKAKHNIQSNDLKQKELRPVIILHVRPALESK